MKDPKKLVVLFVIVALIAAFFYFDARQYLSFSYLKSQKEGLQAYWQNEPFTTAAVYLLIYIAVTALSLPGAAIMTLAGGAIFGLFMGTILVSFASSIGATLAFLASRYIVGNAVQKRFSGGWIGDINRGIEREGSWYLFTMRLIPALPFFAINLIMGLTPMRVLPFFFVSQLGMLPGTVVYVNAGTQLGQLDSLSGILSPGLLISFVILGIFPIAVKKIMAFFPKNAVEQAKEM